MEQGSTHSNLAFSATATGREAYLTPSFRCKSWWDLLQPPICCIHSYHMMQTNYVQGMDVGEPYTEICLALNKTLSSRMTGLPTAVFVLTDSEVSVAFRHLPSNILLREFKPTMLGSRCR